MTIKEIGKVKDIYWYLRGAIELKGICELTDVHLIALKNIIEEAQRETQKADTKGGN